MKFARGLAVFSVISASLPLAIACGSASNDLFSPSGGSSSAAGAGNGTSSAGASSGGALENGGAAGHEADLAGGTSGGESSGGSSGAAMSGGGESGSLTAGAGGAVAGSAGANSGTGGGNAGSANAGTGGASAGAGGGAGAGGAGAGAGGMGGSAGAPACPVSGAPQDGASCSAPTPDSCFYSGEACSCLQQGGPGQRQWGCYGTPNKCPDAKPTQGYSCKPNIGAECPYPGNDFCACVVFGNEAHWVCQAAQPVCGQTKPNQGADCTAVRTCAYGDVACFCNGNKWGCEGG